METLRVRSACPENAQGAAKAETISAKGLVAGPVRPGITTALRDKHAADRICAALIEPQMRSDEYTVAAGLMLTARSTSRIVNSV